MKTPTAFAAILMLVFSAVLRADSYLDRKIEDAARASYNFHVVLERRVTVTAENGVVTLSGTVLDRDQKALAEDTVRSLPGVTGIRNHLDVSEPGLSRSDGWIALKLRSILLLRRDMSGTAIDVTVRNGIVTLKGIVDSAAQKESTEVYARNVQGVRSVRNEIEIRESADAGRPADRQPVAERIDDGAITAQVMDALFRDDSTRALRPSVSTQNGEVLIRGVVRSVAEKQLVTERARGVRGVGAVTNEMIVAGME